MRELKKPNFVKNKKLVRTTTFLAVLLIATTLLLSGSVTSISISGESTNLNTTAKPVTGSIRELSPNVKTSLKVQPEGPRDMWDVQFDFDVTSASGAAGNAGSEWDGSYFYTTRWASNLLHKYNPDGTLVQQFSVAGVSGLRDLAYDGTYFWGGNGGGTLWQMDFDTQTAIQTFTGSFQARAIAYGDDDIIYTSGWGDPVYKIDPATGTILGTFNLATTTSTYGFAYDGLTAGGPFLWVYDQGSGSSTPQYIHQWDLAAGVYTGVQHDTTIEFPDPSGIAGGLFFTDDFEPGFSTLGGLQQGVPDRMFCYEIAVTVAPEHDVQLKSIDEPSSGPGGAVFTPKVTVKNNGNNSETNFPVTMQIKKFGTPIDYWCDGFESFFPSDGWSFPCGWTVQTTNPTGTWFMYSSSTSYSASTYPRVQESGSDGNAQDESIVTSSIDCSALSTVHVQMYPFYFYSYASDYATFTMYVSNDGGSTWNQAVQYTATTTGVRDIDVTTYAAGQSDVKFKFRFESPADTTLNSYCYFDNFWVGNPTTWGPLGDNPPPGWSIQNYPTNPSPWTNNYWHRYTSMYTSYDGMYYPARVYYTSPYQDVDCALITPSIDCSALSTVYLYLNGYFYYYATAPGRGYIEISTDGGTTWADTGAITNTGSQYFYEYDGGGPLTYRNNLDISSWAAGQSNVKVRFRYEHTSAEIGRYWYLSNVRVGGDRCNIIFYNSFNGEQVYSTNFKLWVPDDCVNWAWERVSGTSTYNNWLNVESGTLPTCSPHGGARMAEYNSYSASSGNQAFLYQISPVSVGTAVTLKAGFWMYHDTGAGADTIQVMADDGSGWANAGTPISRQGDDGWAYHTVNLPTASQIRVGFLATSGYGYNMFIDDVCIFDPGLVTEYSQTKYVSLAVGETKQVIFPDWNPAAWHNEEGKDIIYPMVAWTALPGDENPSNDIKTKEITLNYPFFHDIAVISVDSPNSDGPGKTLPVKATIKNVGQYPECCYQTMAEIGKILGAFINEDFSGVSPPALPSDWYTNLATNWKTSATSNAGGASPEAMFSWTPSQVGTWRLYTGPMDTTGVTNINLEFKEYVNDYNGLYDLAVETSTDGTNWNIAYTRAGGPYGPATTIVPLTTANGLGSSTFYVSFTFIGDSFNINYWYIDDIVMMAPTIVKEYEDLVCTIELDPGEQATLEFDDWTPAALATGVSGPRDYMTIITQQLPGDTNPTNDMAVADFTLDFWHDAKLKEITAPSMGRGDVIFAQRPYLPTESWGFYTSAAGGPYLCQDDFWDLTDTIGDIEFWGLCLIYSAGWIPGNPNTLPFELKFYEDSAGAPGAVVETFALPAITPVNTGLTYSGFTMYYWSYDLPTSIGLANGWVSIQSQTAPDNAWLLWAGSPEGNLNALQNGGALGDSLAFNLSKGGVPGPVDVSVWVPLNSDESISGIVQNLGTFAENGLTCYAEIYEYITNESGVQVYSDSVPNIDLSPLGDEEAVIFDNYIFAMQGTYNLILNIPLIPEEKDDIPGNNIKKLGIGCDNAKPVSTHTLNPATPNGLNGWYVSDLTVTLDATDGTEDWQSGVKEIAYQIDSGPIKIISGAHGSFKIEDDGENIQVKYWAVDKVGNTETQHSFTVDMDQTKPTISMIYEATGNPMMGYTFTFTATATDDTSKMERVEFYFNDVLQETVTGSGPTYQWIIPYEPIPHATVKGIAYDIAGNFDSDEIIDPKPHSNEQSLPNSVTTVKINLGR